MATNGPFAGEFGFLTTKQKEVIDLLANHRTTKEIAHVLGLSETSVNRRIEVVKQRLGGITRLELARRYSLWKSAHLADDAENDSKTADGSPPPCVETRVDILQLAETRESGERSARDSEASEMAFEDSIAMSIEAPWKEWSEPRIVPRVLDGDNATLARGVMIAVLLLAIVASIVVALAAAKALADAVS